VHEALRLLSGAQSSLCEIAGSAVTPGLCLFSAGGMAAIGIRGPNPILEKVFNVVSLHIRTDSIVAADNDVLHPKDSLEAAELKKKRGVESQVLLRENGKGQHRARGMARSRRGSARERVECVRRFHACAAIHHPLRRRAEDEHRLRRRRQWKGGAGDLVRRCEF
jgi:hypothetical protein